MRLFLPATLQAKKLYETLCDRWFADDGTQALIKLYWNLPMNKNSLKEWLFLLSKMGFMVE